MAAPSKAAVQAMLKKDNRAVVGTADPSAPTDKTKVGVFYGLGPNGADYGHGGINKADADNDSTWLAGGDIGLDPTAAPDPQIVLVPLIATAGAAGIVGTTHLGVNDIRTQNFFAQGTSQGQVVGYDATKPGFGAKRVYVNQFGEPLDATGAPAASTAAAVDAGVAAGKPNGTITIPVAAITTAMKDATKAGKYWTQANDSKGRAKGLWLGPVTNYAQVNRSIVADATDKAYESAARTPVPGSYQASIRQTSLYAPYVGWTVQD